MCGRRNAILFGCWIGAMASLWGQHVQAAEPSRDDVEFSRDIAPLLSKHCLECHGPDAEQRQAGLRLDQRPDAVALLESGRRAIAPGDVESSALVERVAATGDERMPPPASGAGLSDDEIQRLKKWIAAGAIWESHWAFQPLADPDPPSVANATWCRSPIDRFVLKQMENANQSPRPSADRRRLIRRLYLDVLGVPPTPAETLRFLNDQSPASWERLVERALASPLYGQRWGRHWLDVARYGDSNGGDENHAYPLAWKYRDYVIAAFNSDLPFDAFLHEQIAGDLLPSGGGAETRARERVTATGFLALGTKILAERDKVKMRADLVDEQIDTLGKTFLALTLGCARCHDHKFDPIPASDYYALAGILHSTNLGDQAVPLLDWAERKKAFDERLQQLLDEQVRLRELVKGVDGEFVEREAEKFDRGNVTVNTSTWGKGIGIISDPGAQDNFAEYDFSLKRGGKYLVQLRYAAASARPGKLSVNGAVVREPAIGLVTGGWMPEHQQWCSEGLHEFRAGKNIVRVESKPLMSHIDRIRLIRVTGENKLAQVLLRIESIERDIAAHRKTEPQPEKAMGAGEGSVGNVRIHMRGSHLDLGEEVPRGFPRIVSATSTAVRLTASTTQSGRLELAQWMTDARAGSGGQTARVIANRLWHWHFGRGIVATPNDFGRQGQRPTHPELLNWLASRLVAADWSLKALHREILASATYRQQSVAEPNALWVGVPRRRLDAEVIRDSLLFHAGRLDTSLVGPPLMVKSQDPSPADLRQNEQTYRDSRRRSVYLPVVRSNGVRFLTLFDFPNAATPVGVRDSTTAPTQALLLMNSPFVLQQAEAAAGRLASDDSMGDEQRIQSIYRQLLGRSARDDETAAALGFVQAFRAGGESQNDLAPWVALCQTLFSSNEFVYVE